MSDASDLTLEVLKQIRDGVLEMKAEITSLRNQVTYVHQEQQQTNQRLESLRTELKEEIGDLRRTVVRVGVN